MQNSPEIREYRFGAYRLSNQQQCLYFEGKTLSLSTKIYYLLLALVENAGQVLSKDEIIEAVWPGQIVTDTALAKQVLRLRTLLQDQTRKEPFIETHRGVGYRFTPQVEIAEVEASLFSNPAPPRRSWAGYLSVGAVILGVYLLSTHLQKGGLEPGESSDAINLAVMQMSERADWLNLGGVEYLSDLISDSGLVYAINPEAELLETRSAEEVAVSLTHLEKINYSFMLDVSQQSNQFLVSASLRSKDGIVASTEIAANTLPVVFEKTRDWIEVNLPATTKDNSSRSSGSAPTQDDYALQSYLQGLSALRSEGNYQKAAQYFRAAVNSDPDFLQAWTKLARSLTEVGDQNEALSIGLTLLENPGVSQDDQLNVEIHYVIASAYNRMGDGENAAAFLRKTQGVIAAADNPYVRLDGLESLSMLAGMERNLDLAESFALERLALAKEFYPFPNYLASIHLQLASQFEHSSRPEKMQEHAKEGIRLSEIGQNPNGMISGYRYLNSFNYAANRLDDGVQAAIQADPFLQQSAVSYDQAFFLQFSAMILNLRGLFDGAEQYSNQLKTLSLESNNSLYEVLSDFTVLHRLYVQHQFAEARAYASAMRARFKNDAVMRSALPDAMVIEATVAARVDDLQEAIRLLSEVEEKYASSTDRLRNDLDRTRGHIAVRQGRIEEGLELLHKAERSLREKSHQTVANYTGYEILEILLENPSLEYQSVIDRLEQYTAYDYLFFKLKAQFSAREGNYLKATMLMQENRLRANQLWKPEDQLLLEFYQQQSST